MKINKFLLAALIAVIVPLAGQAAANVNISGLKASLEELRDKHANYKAQVLADELTREEAINLWKADLKTFRAQKNRFFENKMNGLRVKYGKLAQKNPEKAAEIRARFEQKKQQREQRKTELKGLLNQRRSGEISKEQFREALKARQAGRANRGTPNTQNRMGRPE